MALKHPQSADKSIHAKMDLKKKYSSNLHIQPSIFINADKIKQSEFKWVITITQIFFKSSELGLSRKLILNNIIGDINSLKATHAWRELLTNVRINL